MSDQLHFEGDPIFEPPTIHYLLKKLYVEPMKEYLEKDQVLLFGNWPPIVHYRTQPLFDPTPQCGYSWEIGGDTYLDCHLDAGHKGLHYDGVERIEWFARSI